MWVLEGSFAENLGNRSIIFVFFYGNMFIVIYDDEVMFVDSWFDFFFELGNLLFVFYMNNVNNFDVYIFDFNERIIA